MKEPQITLRVLACVLAFILSPSAFILPKYARKESNLHQQIRRLRLYPLSYRRVSFILTAMRAAAKVCLIARPRRRAAIQYNEARFFHVAFTCVAPIFLMSISSPTSSPPPLPPLFDVPTHLIGWQGMTVTVPEPWNFVQFGGDHSAGHFSLTDDDGPRLELRWETPERTVDLEKSVADFVKRIGGDLKKQKHSFEEVPNLQLLSKTKKRKAQLASFGWKSDGATLGQGYGIAWQCEKCGRVVVAQIIGRGGERPGKLQSLTSEVFASMECHGSGGWETWSVFGLRVEIPEEFRLNKARLLTGRIEFDWTRGAARGVMAFFARDERIALSRHALANLVLQNESLHDWTRRVVMSADKRTFYRALLAAPLPGNMASRGKPPRDVKTRAPRVLAGENAATDEAENGAAEAEIVDETLIGGAAPFRDDAPDESETPSDKAAARDAAQNADALLTTGFLRDFRRVAMFWLLDKVRRRRVLPIELRVWHSESVNKIFVVKSELAPDNAHVVGDVIDSLESN